MKYTKKTKTVQSLIISFLLIIALVGCSASPETSQNDNTTSVPQTQEISEISETSEVSEVSGEYSGKDLDDTWTKSDSTSIILSDNSAEIEGTGVTFENKQLTITQEGTYIITGNLSDGQIVVNAAENDDVHVVLNGTNITNATGPALYAISGDKLILTLEANTSNTLNDGTNYILDQDSDQPNATLYSKIDLTINGTGSLSVTGNYDAGIRTKDDLIIISGNISIDAKGDALKGKDSISIKDGAFIFTAGDDGLQSNNDEDAAKGWILIEGGTFDITAQNDAFSAETDLTVNAGIINLIAKDDAFHSEVNLTINGGKINIESSYEGLEAQTIIVNGGDIILNSSDDGINAASDTRTNQFVLNGGSIYMNAAGDGLDTNGSFTINGGSIIIDGPVMNQNGALDYDASGIINGGTLIAAGSSGMAQTPSSESTQGAFMISFTTEQTARTAISIKDADGKVILTHTPEKSFQSIVFSSNEINKGAAYAVEVNGSQLTSVTMTDLVMTFSDSGESIEGELGQMPGGQKPGGQKPTRP